MTMTLTQESIKFFKWKRKYLDAQHPDKVINYLSFTERSKNEINKKKNLDENSNDNEKAEALTKDYSSVG